LRPKVSTQPSDQGEPRINREPRPLDVRFGVSDFDGLTTQALDLVVPG
jgi:hypothetical protein